MRTRGRGRAHPVQMRRECGGGGRRCEHVHARTRADAARPAAPRGRSGSVSPPTTPSAPVREISAVVSTCMRGHSGSVSPPTRTPKRAHCAHDVPVDRHVRKASEFIRRSSEVIRGHQRSSEVIRGTQRSSVGHQRSSEVIRGHSHRAHDVPVDRHVRGGAMDAIITAGGHEQLQLRGAVARPLLHPTTRRRGHRGRDAGAPWRRLRR